MSVGGGVESGEQSQSSSVTTPGWMPGLSGFLNQGVDAASGALSGMQNLFGGDTVADFTPEQLASFDMMKNFIGGAGDFLPTAQNTFLDAAKGVGTGFLDPGLQERLSGAGFDIADHIGKGRDAVGFTENDTARDALNRTARGDYLFGGEGFDSAVDAAVRAAQPHIASAFGGDASSVDSGLSRHAVGQSAVDAFAGQYANERRNQIGAASDLEAGGRQDRSTFLGFGESGANRARRGDEMLAGLSDEERRRQMSAAGALPGIGTMDADMMMEIGNMMQGQNQSELSGPIKNQLMMLQAALSGVPISQLLGQDSSGSYSSQNFGGGWII